MASAENLDKVQMGLAAGGMVPGPTGIASDLTDAGISLGRGDLLGALLAGGAAIPGLGMAFGARHLGKLGKARKLAGGGGMLPPGIEDISALRHADEGVDLERAMTAGDDLKITDEVMAERALSTRGGKGMADFPDRKMLDEASSEIKKLEDHYDMRGDDMYDNLDGWSPGAGEFATRIIQKDPIATQLYLRAQKGRPGGVDPRNDFEAIVKASDAEKSPMGQLHPVDRGMTGGPEDSELIDNMTDEYMRTGDMRELPPGMQATDVDAGFYPAGRAPYGSDIERVSNSRQASYGLDPYEGQHVEQMYDKDMAEYIAKHGGPPPVSRAEIDMGEIQYAKDVQRYADTGGKEGIPF